MRIVSGTTLVLAALFATLSAPRAESQGIGGLIKKKAADAAKGKDSKKEIAKDDGPLTSQFAKECGPVTPDGIEKFLKGLQAEIAGRKAYDTKLAGTVPDSVVNACRQKEQMSPDARALIQRGLENGGTTEYVQKQINKNREDLLKYLTKKCGVPESQYASDKNLEYEAARKAGAAAAGVGDNCYNKLKEFALAFCKGLTPAQQKTAMEQGIKVPGQGSGIYWVFTADEAKALSPFCGQLVSTINATGYTVY